MELGALDQLRARRNYLDRPHTKTLERNVPRTLPKRKDSNPDIGKEVAVVEKVRSSDDRRVLEEDRFLRGNCKWDTIRFDSRWKGVKLIAYPLVAGERSR